MKVKGVFLYWEEGLRVSLILDVVKISFEVVVELRWRLVRFFC